jgi:putative DNA primase/helicase
MIEEAQPLCAALPEDFDRDPFLVNCQNGTLDLRTGELRPHDPAGMLSKVVPVAYDPAASCPTWLAFLDRIFAGNQTLVAYVQRAVGAALVGLVQEQCFHILVGSGANGKTTFLETVRRTFGDYAKHAASVTFLTSRTPNSIRTDLVRLRGARFVTASETSQGGTLDEATVKALTGGDTVTARGLYREEEEFTPACHLFIATNHKPRIRGTDHAIWRRVRLIPFDVTIPSKEQDLALGDKLRAELPGIFAWSVEGALAVQATAGRLDPPPEVLQAIEEYRLESDLVGQFLADHCVTEPHASVGAQELYEAFTTWWHEEKSAEGGRPPPLKEFRESLISRGFEQKRREQGNVWLSLRPRERPSIETWLACLPAEECALPTLQAWTGMPLETLATVLGERVEQGEVVLTDGCYALAPDGRAGQRWAQCRESASPTI